MKIVRNVAAVVSLAVLAGCELGLTDFEPIDFDAFSLSLWQENTSGVYFLPPLMHSSYSGEFDAGRNPVVHICRGMPADPCADPVEVFDMVLDPGESMSRVLRVSLPDEHYIVNWNTKGVPPDQYRIFVLENGAELAYIDVAAANNIKRMRTYEASGPRLYAGTIPIKFRIEVVETEPGPEPEPEPTNGLRAQYYDWSAAGTPDFATASLLAERVDPVVDFDDPMASGAAFDLPRGDHLLARWTGTLVAPAMGFFTFCVVADDGVRLQMNGFMFVDSWQEQDDFQSCPTAFLTEGQEVPIQLEWFHSTGGGTVQLFWESAGLGIAREIVPSSVLLPN